jgi:hypothetical protein
MTEESKETDKHLILGYRESISKAIGKDLSDKLVKGEYIDLRGKNVELSTYEQDLVLSTDAKLLKITSEQGRDVYYQEKMLDGNLKMAAVYELDERKTSLETAAEKSRFGTPQLALYKCSNLLLTNSQTGEGIELLDWVSGTTKDNVFLKVRKGDRPEKEINEHGGWFIVDDEESGDGEIGFRRMNGLVDSMAVIHEAGHLKTLKLADKDIRIRTSVARTVAKFGANVVESCNLDRIEIIESDTGIQMEEAMPILRDDERQAESMVDAFIKETESVLSLQSEGQVQAIYDTREKNFQSYDKCEFGGSLVTALFVDGAVSDKLRNLIAGKEEILHEHYELVKECLGKFTGKHEKRVNEWQFVVKDGIKYRILFNRSFVNVNWDTPDGVKHHNSISFTTTNKNDGKDDGDKMLFSLRNYDDLDSTIGNIEKVIELDKNVLNILNHLDR